jgi:hypothetical protein
VRLWFSAGLAQQGVLTCVGPAAHAAHARCDVVRDLTPAARVATEAVTCKGSLLGTTLSAYFGQVGNFGRLFLGPGNSDRKNFVS